MSIPRPLFLIWICSSLFCVCFSGWMINVSGLRLLRSVHLLQPNRSQYACVVRWLMLHIRIRASCVIWLVFAYAFGLDSFTYTLTTTCATSSKCTHIDDLMEFVPSFVILIENIECFVLELGQHRKMSLSNGENNILIPISDCHWSKLDLSMVQCYEICKKLFGCPQIQKAKALVRCLFQSVSMYIREFR